MQLRAKPSSLLSSSSSKPWTGKLKADISNEISASVGRGTNIGGSQKRISRRGQYVSQPGFTAKNQIRHFVQHHYKDHSLELPSSGEPTKTGKKCKQRSETFPVKLHKMLEDVEAMGGTHIVSWQEHGRAFLIHDSEVFVNKILPHYFNQSKITSFQRQLNLYGFERLTRGPDAGAYYNEYFLRGRGFLVRNILRAKVKGTRYKAAANPEEEPDFYAMGSVCSLESLNSMVHKMNNDSKVETSCSQNILNNNPSNPSDPTPSCPIGVQDREYQRREQDLAISLSSRKENVLNPPYFGNSSASAPVCPEAILSNSIILDSFLNEFGLDGMFNFEEDPVLNKTMQV